MNRTFTNQEAADLLADINLPQLSSIADIPFYQVIVDSFKGKDNTPWEDLLNAPVAGAASAPSWSPIQILSTCFQALANGAPLEKVEQYCQDNYGQSFGLIYALAFLFPY